MVALCGVLVPLAMGTAFGYFAGKVGWLPGATLLEDVFSFGLHGIWTGVLSDQLSRLILLRIRFAQGNWTKIRI